MFLYLLRHGDVLQAHHLSDARRRLQRLPPHTNAPHHARIRRATPGARGKLAGQRRRFRYLPARYHRLYHDRHLLRAGCIGGRNGGRFVVRGDAPRSQYHTLKATRHQ